MSTGFADKLLYITHEVKLAKREENRSSVLFFRVLPKEVPAQKKHKNEGNQRKKIKPTRKFYAKAVHNGGQSKKITPNSMHGSSEEQTYKTSEIKENILKTNNIKRGFTDSPLLKGISVNLRNIHYLDIIIYIHLNLYY